VPHTRCAPLPLVAHKGEVGARCAGGVLKSTESATPIRFQRDTLLEKSEVVGGLQHLMQVIQNRLFGV
jgi:hypothetical protein